MTLFQRYKRLTFWNKLGAVASVVGILAFILAVITLPIFERSKREPPSISLDIGPALNHKDPFGVTFIICNQGKQPIYNVSQTFYWNNPETGKRIVWNHAISNPIPKLGAGLKATVHITDQKPFPLTPGTWVNVDIGFSTDFPIQETNKVFQFRVVKDDSDNYVWLPTGEGETINSIFNNIEQLPTNIMDAIPFLDVQVTAVKDVSQQFKDHPIEIDYSWKNVGGIPATGVYVELEVTDSNFRNFIAWSNQWSQEIFNEVLYPSTTKKMSTLYSDRNFPTILNGIMSGNLILCGEASFKDTDNQDFDLFFKAIRTNGEFEVRYTGVGGCFLSPSLNGAFNNVGKP